MILAIAGLSAAIQLAPAPRAAAQELDTTGKKLYYTVKPLQGGNMDEILEQSATGAGLQMWKYSIKSTRTGTAGMPYSTH